MNYPIVLHKDIDSDYGVTVPDLPGCFSAGDSIDDALTNAVEAIECHLESMLIDGDPIPPVRTVEFHQQDPLYVDGIWALAPVDISKLAGKSKRVNITVPERLLSLMDQYASTHGATRSKLIAEATIEYIATHTAEQKPEQKPT